MSVWLAIAMRGGCYGALAARLGQDEEKWKIAGLLHELDIEIVDNDLDRHGFETEKILKER